MDVERRRKKRKRTREDMMRNRKSRKKRMERDWKVRKKVRREAKKYNYGQSETCMGFQEKARVDRMIYEEFGTGGWLSKWKQSERGKRGLY